MEHYKCRKQLCRCSLAWYILLPVLFLVMPVTAVSQVEHVQLIHPVYNFLSRAAVRGTAGDISTAVLPLQRREVVEVLQRIRQNENALSTADRALLLHFEQEFDLQPIGNAVVFTSATDSTQVLFDRLLSNDRKYIYHYQDSASAASIVPLGSFEYRARSEDSSRSAVLGQVGLRLYGTIDNFVGYYLQVTNGALLAGNRSVALADPLLQRNVKFGELNSDFDFTESHVHLEYGHLFASVGRETRTIGSGYFNSAFLSNAAAPFDAVTVGAAFDNFDYRFMHGSMLALPVSGATNGASVLIPSKYIAFHRFAYHDSWGEVGFQESVIYSGRGADLGYLNPLSFFKSVEHSLHDRDNPALGFDLTLRPTAGLEVKGSFLLDDLRFEKIGTDYWGNKSAWNIGAMYALSLPVDVALEYAVVYPYTYSHFNVQNAMTNDGLQVAGGIPPNSARISAMLRWWWGQRYPVTLTVSSLRHGRNIYDDEGNLVKNVGGDILQTRRYEDSEEAPFLDGDLQKLLTVTLRGGVEIARGFNVQMLYKYTDDNGSGTHEGRIGLFYEDF